MNEIKVSVAIPVYNGEKYLKQCLDSIIHQTLKEIEIICVDDGSTDSTLQIIEEYIEKDKRVKVLRQENRGAGAARNLGLSVAQGKYLLFLDADDFFELDYLERVYQKATETNAEMVVAGSDQYYEETKSYKSVPWVIRQNALPPYRPMNFRTFTDNVFKVFVGWAWDKLFEREFIQRYNLKFQGQRTSNDLLFVFTALVLAQRIEVEPKVLIHQRRDNPNSLSNTREKSWDCFYHALIALRENLRKYDLYQELEQDYINYALHFSLWNLETLQGEKQKILYQKLKTEWFRELHITNHPKQYFYDEREYEKYRKIMTI